MEIFWTVGRTEKFQSDGKFLDGRNRGSRKAGAPKGWRPSWQDGARPGGTAVVRQQSFGECEIVMSGDDTLSSAATTPCPLWKQHVVRLGNNTLSSPATTHCPLRQRHIALLGSDALSSLATTHWPFRQRHIVLFRNDTLSSPATTHCPLRKRHIVLCGNDTWS